MTNKEIGSTLKLIGQLMELHNENPFKVKSYLNAAFKLGKTEISVYSVPVEDLGRIDGIGKTISEKIIELRETGTISYLQELLNKTPSGIVEMLSVKGIGPSKVRLIWKELGAETIGELLYACNENRLVSVKGFGEKTQSEIKKAIEFKLASSGKFHYASLEPYAENLVKSIRKALNSELVSLTGAMRRKCEIIEVIDVLVGNESHPIVIEAYESFSVPINILTCSPDTFFLELFKSTGVDTHNAVVLKNNSNIFNSEEEVYEKNNLSYIVPEMREGRDEFEWIKKNKASDLIENTALKGILHNHSTWSDGINTLEEMAVYCNELGYEYLGICDHSQSAFYAKGLTGERVAEQHKEIDALNMQLAPFKIFKGIESDILYDGSLDYEESILKSFDFIVASIHSTLKMDCEKATSRLIRAIENPYTTILGHPTGRLLLSREGYPIDHKKVIDACAASGVVIELNANPMRLDIDWRWIYYAMEKNVMIAINPDAHNRLGYHHMHFGVCAARKGGLTQKMTFNALSKNEIEIYFNKRKQD